MKIGILTFHREENFGAALQAFALKTFLSQQGYKVEIIDYDPKYRSENRNLISPIIFRNKDIVGKTKMILSAIKRYISNRKIKKIFSNFQSEYFNLTKSTRFININDAKEEYDVVIVGSDQIWQPFIANNGNFDQAYFSGYPKSKRHLSYAGSMGNINFLQNGNDKIFIDYISRLDNVLSREEDLNLYLNQKGIRSQLVSDPVFLLTRTYWEKFIENHAVELPEKFIFVHRATNLNQNKLIVEQLIAHEDLPIVVLKHCKLPFHQTIVKISELEQVLYILSKATYIITSSFHCTAFSLIFDRNLISYNQNPERAKTITSKLGVPYRCIEKYTESAIDKIINDHTSVEYDTNEFVLNSRKTLLKSLQNE